MAKLTIFGLAGTGKSTVASLVAAETGFELLSAGNLFRKAAETKGVSVYEYNEMARSDQSFDTQIDTYITDYGKLYDDFILEAWLGWYFIPDSFKVKLICEESERISRIASREGLSEAEAREKTRMREESKADRFCRYYGLVDFPPSDAIFNMVLDTTNLNPEIAAKMIRTKLGEDVS